MAKIHIRIGEVRTLDTENWQTIPDDRQQQVEIIGGSVVQDFGRVPEGDKISCTVTVLEDGWKSICEFWEKRTLVTVEDEAGNLLEMQSYIFLLILKPEKWEKMLIQNCPVYLNGLCLFCAMPYLLLSIHIHLDRKLNQQKLLLLYVPFCLL